MKLTVDSIEYGTGGMIIRGHCDEQVPLEIPFSQPQLEAIGRAIAMSIKDQREKVVVK